jgi:ribosomal protein S18 acetylase RimI-like enzyme
MKFNIIELEQDLKLAAALSKIDKKCFDKDYYSKKQWIEVFKRKLKIFGCWDNKGKDLICYCAISYEEHPDIAVGYFLSNAVLKEYQNLGLGSRLIETRLSSARELGLRVLFAQTRLTNSASAHILKKYGFEIESYDTGYYYDEDGLSWKLQL